MIPSASSTNLAEELRASVSRFVRTTRQHADVLPVSRAETLRHLRIEGPQTMAALAVSRNVSHQSVSRMVGELEKLGLVVRGENPADARGFVIALSEAGRQRLDEDMDHRRTIIAAAIDTGLSRAERNALAQLPAILDRLAERLDDSIS
jgi:DNA-binding MarR family transcriptional regulator